MTAIYGLWHYRGRPDVAADGARMGRSLAIYGADRKQDWRQGEIVLGTDLSITTPEDRLDRQPLIGGQGRFCLVADIRLDNRPELASALGWTDAVARAAADADFALAAWERWGEGALDRLIGDWALAVWDRDDKTLTLARDFLGMRPLFYRVEPDRIAFASMAKGIHALPGVPIAPDPDTLRDLLALLPMRGEKSFFAGIARVEPGAVAVIHADGRVDRRAWYVWRLDRQADFASDAAAVETFRATFDRAVADRLRSVSPIACQLSGGFDSTAVAAAAALQLAPTGKRLTAYTHVPMRGVSLEEPEGRFADEWPLAHTLAARYPNIDHVAVAAAERNIGDDFDADVFYNERPMTCPYNGIWGNAIYRQAARAKQKVLLVGSYGNATISQSGEQRLSELLAAGRLRTWAREAAAFVRHGATWRSALVGQSLLPLLPSWLVRLVRFACGRNAFRLADYSALHPTVAAGAAFRARLKELDVDIAYVPWRSRRAMIVFLFRRIDAGAFFKGAWGQFGVEYRDPTADRRLVELALALPSRLFFQLGQKKWIYVQAFSDRIPPEILCERRKGYQGADWLARLTRGKDALRAQTRSALETATATRLIDTKTLKKLLDEPLPAKANRAIKQRYRQKLLRGLAVAHFIATNEAANHGKI